MIVFMIFVFSFRAFRPLRVFVVQIVRFVPFVLSWFNGAGRDANPRLLPRPDLRRRTYCNSVKVVYNFTMEGCEFMYKMYGA